MPTDTHGWDLVYAMRFPQVNQGLDTSFTEEATAKQLLRRQVLNVLAETDYQPAQAQVMGVLESRQYLYTQTPRLRLYSLDKGELSCTLKPLLRVIKAEVTADGTGYMTGGTVLFSGGNPARPATGELTLGVKAATITDPGSIAYSTPPTVTFNTGTGSGAAAVALLDAAGYVTAIQITNEGSGYDAANPPTITLTGGGGSGATADAVLGLSIRITDTGAGYTSPPSVAHAVGSGLSATILLQLEDIGGINAYESDFQAPVLTIERVAGDSPHRYDAATGTVAPAAVTDVDKAVTTFTYSVPGRLLASGDTGTALLLRLLQAALLPTLHALGAQCELQRSGAAADAEITDAMKAVPVAPTDAVADVLERWVRAAHTQFLAQVKVYSPNAQLALLQKAAAGITGFAEEAAYLVASTKKWPAGTTPSLANLIKLLEADETAKVLLRMRRALRNVDASVVFDYTAAAQPTATPHDLLLPLSALPDPANGPRQQSVYVHNATEVALAVLPEHYSDTLVGLGQLIETATYQLQKIRLYTAPWQLIPGGNGTSLLLKVPIRAGVLYFGRNPLLIEPKHQLYMTLRVKLTWLKGATLTTQVLRPDSVVMESLLQETGSVPLPNWSKLQLTLQEFIGNTLNPQRYPADPAQHRLLAPVDYAFSFNHAFAALNKLEHVAETEAAFAWMYPTTASYCVRDEYDDDPDPANSLLAVCCMTENRPNNSPPDVDLQAVPAGDNAAVLLSKELLLRHFVLPYVALMFKVGDRVATKDDFIEVNRQAFTNRVPLTTEALEIKVDENLLIGTVAQGTVLLEVREGMIHLSFRDVAYTFDQKNKAGILSTEHLKETKARISKSFGLTFGLIGDPNDKTNTAKQLKITPILLDSAFSLEPSDPTSITFWEILGGAGLTFLSTFVISALFAGASYGWSRMGNCIRSLRDGRPPRRISPTEAGMEIQQLRGNTPATFALEPAPALDAALELVREQIKDLSVVGDLRFNTYRSEPVDFKLSSLIRTNEAAGIHTLRLEVEHPNNRSTRKVTFLADYRAADGHIKLRKDTPTQQTDVPIDLERLRPNIEERILPAIGEILRRELLQLPAEGLTNLSALDNSAATITDQEPRHAGLRTQKRLNGICDLLKHMGERGWKSTTSFDAVSALVGTSLAGGLIWMYYSDVDKRYQQYKTQAGKNLDNVMQNGVTYLTNNLTGKVNWPALADHSLALSSFFLDGSIVIGLRSTPPQLRRRLQGYVSVDNPSVPLVQLAANTRELLIENTGDNPLLLGFIDNTGGYQGMLDQSVGHPVEVPAHSVRTVALSAFNLPATGTSVLCVRTEENDTTYALTPR